MKYKTTIKQTSLFKDRNAIPTSHDKDTNYEKHCVDCGKKVVQYDVDRSDYDRNCRGEKIWGDDGFTAILAGKRCWACSRKILLHIEDYYNQ